MKWKRIWISLWLLTLLAIFIVTLINRTPYFLLGGSSSVGPVMEELLNKYPNNHKTGDFNYVSSASAGAPPRVEKNLFGIGWLSEEYHVDQEQNPNLIDFQMMRDGLVIVYNVPGEYLKNPNQAINFDTETLRSLYLDDTMSWNTVFPGLFNKHLGIKRYTRPNGSGTRKVFDELALNNQNYYQANTVDSSGAMLNLDIGGIGYSSAADYTQAQNVNVKSGTWMGNEATPGNIESDIYKLWRPFTGIINKTYKYKAEIIEFLKWIYGSDPFVKATFEKYGPKIELSAEVNADLEKWLYPAS